MFSQVLTKATVLINGSDQDRCEHIASCEISSIIIRISISGKRWKIVIDKKSQKKLNNPETIAF